MEKENSILRERNYKYYEWISNSPKTLAYLEEEYKTLKAELLSYESSTSKPGIIDSNKIEAFHKSYFYVSKRLEEGNAFIDEHTGASLCVTSISVFNEAKGYYNLPNNEQGNFYSSRPGKSWNFKYKRKSYKMYLQEIDYSTNTYKVMIKEQ